MNKEYSVILVNLLFYYRNGKISIFSYSNFRKFPPGNVVNCARLCRKERSRKRQREKGIEEEKKFWFRRGENPLKRIDYSVRELCKLSLSLSGYFFSISSERRISLPIPPFSLGYIRSCLLSRSSLLLLLLLLLLIFLL